MRVATGAVPVVTAQAAYMLGALHLVDPNIPDPTLDSLCVLRKPLGSAGAWAALAAAIRSSSDREGAWGELESDSRGSDQRAVLTVNADVQFPPAGGYRLLAELSSGHVRSVSFQVRDVGRPANS